MIDPLETVIKYLSDNAALNELTAGRIAAKQRFGIAGAGGWGSSAAQALAVSLAGGIPEKDIWWHNVQLLCRAYGATQQDAVAVYMCVLAIARETRERREVPTGNGIALMYHLTPVQAMTPGLDPETGYWSALFYLTTAVHETPVDA